jgi:microcystin degradation protein MlrC
VIGIDLHRCHIVVKSAIAWRAAYGDVAAAAIEVDTPGPCTADLRRLSFRRLRRPMAPVDADAGWQGPSPAAPHPTPSPPTRT